MIHELHECDVLVVGSGPAGCMAAAHTASVGIDTWLIDAKRRIGEPPHCAEFVPLKIFSDFNISRRSIIQKIECMETTILNGDTIPMCSAETYLKRQTRPRDVDMAANSTRSPSTIETPSPGFMIDRIQFDRELAHRAAQKGATVLCDTKLLARSNEHWILRRGTSEKTVKPRYVVAADGARSTVARLLKLPSLNFQMGAQAEVPLVSHSQNTMVFLHRSFLGGYGWVFPKGMAANVGLGISPHRGVRPWTILQSLLDYLYRNHVVRRGVLASSRGLIPVSGPRRALVSENVLFCGDAASLTHPITGAGVSQALVSGDLAGKLIATAITTDTPQAIMLYDREMKNHFGNVMHHALSKRQLMMTNWDQENFEALCHECWIAYKGYKKRIVKGTRTN